MDSSVLLLLVAVLGLTVTAENYHPDRTLLIDHYPQTNPHNFLFRGNMPNVNGEFAYDQIVASMKTIITQKNFTFPPNFTLIDISYLNIFEEADLKVEEDFFASHSSLGVLHKKPIIGSLIPPPENDEAAVKDLAKLYETASFDKLPELMKFFRQLVTGSDTPSLIYSHCEAGTDRTGEVSGSYYLKYLNMTLTEALAIDNHIQSRDMYKDSRNALQWYCYYLKFIEQKTFLKCTV